jgi:hypothetical protein
VGALGAGGAFSFSFFFVARSLIGVDVPLSPFIATVVFCFFLGGSASVCAVAAGRSMYSGVPLFELGSVVYSPLPSLSSALCNLLGDFVDILPLHGILAPQIGATYTECDEEAGLVLGSTIRR